MRVQAGNDSNAGVQRKRRECAPPHWAACTAFISSIHLPVLDKYFTRAAFG